MNNSGVGLSDPTFRYYTTGQATRYAENRLGYPAELYDLVLRYHAESNGNFKTLLDVGCGPGNATRDLAPHFECAVGIDPGLEMIQTAQRLGGVTKSNSPIEFQVSTAEDCAKIDNVHNGVDLLVSAMAVSPTCSIIPPEDWCRELKRHLFKTKGTLVFDGGFLEICCKDCESRRHCSSLDMRFVVLP